MAGRSGKWGSHDGMPVQQLRLTITGSDVNPERQFATGDNVVIVAVAKVGKQTHVPKNIDGSDCFEEQRVLVVSDYAVLESTEAIDLEEGLNVPFHDLATWARQMSDIRAGHAEDAKAAKKGRKSVTDDIGPEGTAD